MENSKIKQIADVLHNARLDAKGIPQFGDSITDFTRKDAYEIQSCGIKLRKADGENIIGLKMGLTSEAKRKQMDLDSPLYGVLTDKMIIEDGGTYKMKGSIHPKIEPEIAFITKTELKGKPNREEVLKACSAVCSALEILDSRYEQFKYFSMEEVISDNSSSSYFILGPMVEEFEGLDIADLKMEMKVNGKVATKGNSSAISGDPVVSIQQLCELLADRGESIPANTIVLTGAATLAVPLEPNMEVKLEVEGLPPTSVKVSE